MTNSETNLQQIEQRRKQVAYGLFVGAFVLALIPVWLGFKYRTEYLPVCIWGGALALIAVAAGLWQLLGTPTDLSPADARRLLILAVGGLSGIVTVVILGLGLTAKWWSEVTGGWEAWQGKEGWHVWACLLSFVGGLAIMFVSLQLARGNADSSSAYRRLLYAYNTILTGCLLLLILLVANLVVYIPWGPLEFFNHTYYWTDSSIYALSSQSEKILQGLDKPLKVYVIVPEIAEWNRPIHALLDNCRSVQANIQVKYLSPDLDKEEVVRLGKEYKFAAERTGLLLVYGTEPNTEHRFIKYADLQSRDASEMMSRSSQGFFKGEAALISELNSLTEGKEKAVVYFTQGNGELNISDRNVSGRGDDGCGIYRDQLEGKGIKVLGLVLSPVEGVKSKSPDIVVSTKIPDDATIVVIAGPTKRFEKPALDALRNYLEPTDPQKKKGKLVALLDPASAGGGRDGTTGLEDLLASYGVIVGKDRVLQLRGAVISNPGLVLADVPSDDGVRSESPLIDAFAGKSWLLVGARTIQGQTPTSPGKEHYRTVSLLQTDPRSTASWAETNLQAEPTELIRELDSRRELGRRISQDPLSLAVAVSEVMPAADGGPHAFMQGEGKPRLTVFGSSSPLRNSFANARGISGFFDFFASDLSWLRERPSNIGIEAKKRDYYALTSENINFSRMIWLPALLMVVGVLGLATGVWVVRRR